MSHITVFRNGERVVPEIVIERREPDPSKVSVIIEGQTLAIINYVSPWVDNALQWRLARAIADHFREPDDATLKEQRGSDGHR